MQCLNGFILKPPNVNCDIIHTNTSESKTTFTYGPMDNSTIWSEIRADILHNLTFNNMFVLLGSQPKQVKEKINNISTEVWYKREEKILIDFTCLVVQRFQISHPDSKY